MYIIKPFLLLGIGPVIIAKCCCPCVDISIFIALRWPSIVYIPVMKKLFLIIWFDDEHAIFLSLSGVHGQYKFIC